MANGWPHPGCAVRRRRPQTKSQLRTGVIERSKPEFVDQNQLVTQESTNRRRRRRVRRRIPGPTTRNWLANLAAHPQFTFHLKHGIVADLLATASVIVDPAERRRVLAVLIDEFNRRNGPDSPWPEAILDEWVASSPLAKVSFAERD